MYRKKIVELLALYELEPEMKQVWVEGTSDRTFFQWYFTEKKLKSIKVETIDHVEVPFSILEKYGLTSGNRNRAIALALEIEAGLKGHSDHAELLFVLDRDFDDYLGRKIEGKFVAYTDFTSLEMYLFDEALLTKFINLMTATPDRPVDELMDRLACVGSELFSVRTANELLGWGMSMPSPERLLSSANSSLEFDMDTYISRALQSNARVASSAEFLDLVAECRAIQPDEPRCKVRGHDFINLLHWILKNDIRPKQAGQSADLVAKFLFMGANASMFAKFALFNSVDVAFDI